MSVVDLWLPILVAGLVTHVLCTLAWTVLPHHKPEFGRLPAEDDIQDAIAKNNTPAGQYLFPFATDQAEMQSEDFKRRQAQCNGMLILWGQPTAMGPAIVKTLLYFLIVAFCLGYLATLALRPGDDFMTVFRFTATAAILTHCAGLFPGVFWFRRKVALDLLDKLVFALATAAIFAAMWPAVIPASGS